MLTLSGRYRFSFLNVTGSDLTLTSQTIEVGLAVDVYALRVNFVGALGWELHFPIEYAHHLFDALFEVGKEYGIGMVGMRAMESLQMRL